MSIIFSWWWSLLIFCLLELLSNILGRGVLLSPALTNEFIYFSLRYLLPACLPYFDPLLLDSHFRDCYVFVENWPLFIIMECPSLFLIMSLALKSALFEINIATAVFFRLALARHIFLYPVSFNLSVPLYLSWFSCRHHIIGSDLFIHSDSLCWIQEQVGKGK